MRDVLQVFIDRLTDAYKKDPDSNVYKLAQLTVKHLQENEDTYNQISIYQDIDQAEGVALDYLGADVLQPRGQTPDNVYRVLIKSKIKRNLSDGSIETLIDFISFILQIDKKEVTIKELWTVGRPAVLHIDAPAGAVNKTGLSLSQFGTLINAITAGGVKAEVLFEGTFSFASQPATSESDPAAGFADTAQTTGGGLGYAYDPANDYELPI